MAQSKNHGSQLAQTYQCRFSAKVLIAYLYLVQGLVIALCVTIPLTYDKLPSYQILGYFSAATLPFSFKFITAPLIEKYSSLAYGRRKLWVVISMTVAAIVLYFISLIVQNQQKQKQTAALLFIVGFCVSAQDISTDALAVKQLKKPQLASLLQSVFQQVGIVLGSLLLGEMTSQRFGQFFGYESGIISAEQFILFIMAIILVPTAFIHIFFKESCSQKQQTVKSLSLWQVTSHYRHFILPKYRVCRQAILFVIMFQGMNFFTAGYSVEIINSGVLSKQFAISLGNLALLLIFPSTYVLSRFITAQNQPKAERILYLIRGVLIAVIFLVDTKDATFATVSLFLLQLVSSLHFYLNGIVMNSFQDSKFQGMSVTMMASMSNLGRNSSLHLNLIGKYGFRNCVLYSFGYTTLMTFCMEPFHKWIGKGQQQEGSQQIVNQHSD